MGEFHDDFLSLGVKMKSKVFCVGFHKTGTSSLGVALGKLDYRVAGPSGVYDPNIEKIALTMAYDLVEKFDAFQDNPWPILYKQLDEKYPGSKFILMLRNPESWIRSQVMHFGRKSTPMRKWIYGVGYPEGNEQIYIRRFEAHNADVLDYFKDRPQDLLVMDLSKGDGWEKLCPFLGVEIPNIPFPHANEASVREKASSKSIFSKTKNTINRVTKPLSALTTSTRR
jgi:hypothetical protein